MAENKREEIIDLEEKDYTIEDIKTSNTQEKRDEIGKQRVEKLNELKDKKAELSKLMGNTADYKKTQEIITEYNAVSRKLEEVEKIVQEEVRKREEKEQKKKNKTNKQEQRVEKLKKLREKKAELSKLMGNIADYKKTQEIIAEYNAVSRELEEVERVVQEKTRKREEKEQKKKNKINKQEKRLQQLNELKAKKAELSKLMESTADYKKVQEIIAEYNEVSRELEEVEDIIQEKIRKRAEKEAKKKSRENKEEQKLQQLNELKAKKAELSKLMESTTDYKKLQEIIAEYNAVSKKINEMIKTPEPETEKASDTNQNSEILTSEEPESVPESESQPQSRKYPGTDPIQLTSEELEALHKPIPKETRLQKIGRFFEKTPPFKWIINGIKAIGKKISEIMKLKPDEMEDKAWNGKYDRHFSDRDEAEAQAAPEHEEVVEAVPVHEEDEVEVLPDIFEEESLKDTEEQVAERVNELLYGEEEVTVEINPEESKARKKMAREIRKILEEEKKEPFVYKGVKIQNTGSLRVIAEFLEGTRKIEGKGRLITPEEGEYKLRLKPDGTFEPDYDHPLKPNKAFDERLRNDEAAAKVGTREGIEELREGEKDFEDVGREGIKNIKVNENWRDAR